MKEYEILPRSLIVQLVYRWDAMSAKTRAKVCPVLADTIREIKQHLQNEIVGLDLQHEECHLDESKAAIYLGCSLSTIQHRRKANLIAYIKKGRRILYSKEALDRYLEATTIKVPMRHQY